MAPKSSTAQPSTNIDDEWPEIQEPSTEVANASKRDVVTYADGTTDMVSDSDLKELSFADLGKLPAVTADEAIGADQFGPILENKTRLCGVPLVILKWILHDAEKSNFGGFVTMYVLTQNNERFIVNDGSTGVYEQLRQYTLRTGVNAMMACPGGFRQSDYEVELDGRMMPASTFYIEAQQRVR